MSAAVRAEARAAGVASEVFMFCLGDTFVAETENNEKLKEVPVIMPLASKPTTI